jgi:Protein of unknown function (DUF2442)
MLKDIVEAMPLDEYRIHLRFEDGVEGTIDVARIVRFEGVFAPLCERAFFTQVQVNSELGTIVWPNGADLDPDVLYAEITKAPIAIEGRQSARH